MLTKAAFKLHLAKRAFSTLSYGNILIETRDLDKLINTHQESLSIFNATLARGDVHPIENHVKSRIMHSIFFDFNNFCLKGTTLPYMLPTEEQFINLMKELDVRKSDTIVVYDQAG